ncbi:MAG: hypothetical protein KUG83_03675 [Gammaproteobacteria bacterium]|nr:hypothetical protein [Gammaproteobacteria bacterium]
MYRFLTVMAVFLLTSCAQHSLYVEMDPVGRDAEQRPSHPRLSPPAHAPAHGYREKRGIKQGHRGEASLSAAQVALLNQAEQHMAKHKVSLAMSKLERAIRINPHAVKPYRVLAALHLKQGNRRAAAEFARKGLAIIAKKGSPRSFNREQVRLESILAQARSRRA